MSRNRIFPIQRVADGESATLKICFEWAFEGKGKVLGSDEENKYLRRGKIPRQEKSAYVGMRKVDL